MRAKHLADMSIKLTNLPKKDVARYEGSGSNVHNVAGKHTSDLPTDDDIHNMTATHETNGTKRSGVQAMRSLKYLVLIIETSRHNLR